MNEIGVIRFLLDEIEAEMNYNNEYKFERDKAVERTEKENGHWGEWWNYMPNHLQREPRESVIKANAKMIRRLLLKFY